MRSVQEVTRNHKKHDRGDVKCHRIPAVTHAEPLQNMWNPLVNAAERCRKRERRGLTCRFACPGGTAASKLMNSGAGSDKYLRNSAPGVTRNDGNMPGGGRNAIESVQEVTRDQKRNDRGVAKCHRIPAVTHAQPLQNRWISLVNAAKRCRKRKMRGLT